MAMLVSLRLSGFVQRCLCSSLVLRKGLTWFSLTQNFGTSSHLLVFSLFFLQHLPLNPLFFPALCDDSESLSRTVREGHDVPWHLSIIIPVENFVKQTSRDFVYLKLEIFSKSCRSIQVFFRPPPPQKKKKCVHNRTYIYIYIIFHLYDRSQDLDDFCGSCTPEIWWIPKNIPKLP